MTPIIDQILFKSLALAILIVAITFRVHALINPVQ